MQRARITGNRQASRMVAGSNARPASPTSRPQSNLQVSEPDDQYELEADQTADEVVRMSAASPPAGGDDVLEDAPQGPASNTDLSNAPFALPQAPQTAQALAPPVKATETPNAEPVPDAPAKVPAAAESALPESDVAPAIQESPARPQQAPGETGPKPQAILDTSQVLQAESKPGALPIAEATAQPEGLEATATSLEQVSAAVQAEPSPFDSEAGLSGDKLDAVADIGASAPEVAVEAATRTAPDAALEPETAVKEMAASPSVKETQVAPPALKSATPKVVEAASAMPAPVPQVKAPKPESVQTPKMPPAAALAAEIAPAKQQEPNHLNDAAGQTRDLQRKALIWRDSQAQEPAAPGIDATGAVTPEVQENIQTLEHGGEPLSKTTRVDLETRFGEDFSNVRIHRDRQAAETAQSVGARAFTVGQHIAFGAGEYTPETSEGQHLLAHELTHTVQQTGSKPVQTQRQVARSTGGHVVQRGLFDTVKDKAGEMLAKIMEKIRPQADEKAQTIESHAQAEAQGVESQANSGAANVQARSEAEAQGIEQQAETKASDVETASATDSAAIATQSAAEATGVESQAQADAASVEDMAQTEATGVEQQAAADTTALNQETGAQVEAVQSNWGQVQQQSSAGAEQVEAQAQADWAGAQTQADAAVEQAQASMEGVQAQADSEIPIMEMNAEDKLRGLRDQAISIAESVQSPDKVAGSGLGGLLEQAKALLGELGGIVGPVWEMLQNGWQNLQNLATDLWDGAKNLFGKALDTVKNIGGAIWGGIQKGWDGVQRFAGAAWDKISSFGGNLFAGLQTFAGGAFDKVKDLAGGLYSGLQGFAQTAYTRLSDTAGTLVANLGDTATNAWNGLQDTATNAWNGVKSFGSNIWNNLTGKAGGAESNIEGEKSSGESGLTGIAGGFLGKVMSFINNFKQRAGGAKSGMQSRDASAQSQYQSRRQAAEAQHQTHAQQAQAGLQQRNAASQAQLDQTSAAEQSALQSNTQASESQMAGRSQAAQAGMEGRDAAAVAGLEQAQATQDTHAQNTWGGIQQQSSGVFGLFHQSVAGVGNFLQQGWSGARDKATQAGQWLGERWDSITGAFEDAKNRIKGSWAGVVGRAAVLWARATGASPDDSEAWGSIGKSAQSLKADAVQLKTRAGGPVHEQSPVAVMQRLGEGQSFNGAARSRMESAFGTGFGDVQIHTDSNSAQIARQADARALTVGDHIAFDAGEYQPGTMVGDALLAHELAHTVQQRGASAESAAKGYAPEDSAEEMDADKAAVGAVAAHSLGLKGMLTDLPAQVLPRLQTGLRLRRCSKPKVNFANVADVNWLGDLDVNANVADWDDKKHSGKSITLDVANQSVDAGKVEVTPSTISGAGNATITLRGKAPTWSGNEDNLELFGNFDNKEIPKRSNKFDVPDINLDNIHTASLTERQEILRAVSPERLIEWIIANKGADAHIIIAALLEGSLYWPGGSGPDIFDQYKIAPNSDFAEWIRGGDENTNKPTDLSTMNCWEAVLYSAYLAGEMTYAELVAMHDKAAQEAQDEANNVTVTQQEIDALIDQLYADAQQQGFIGSRQDFIDNQVQNQQLLGHDFYDMLDSIIRENKSGASDAYYDVLEEELGANNATNWDPNPPPDPNTGVVPPTADIPSGDIVFFVSGGEPLAHVAISLGTKDANDSTEVMSLWSLPANAMQRTTIEDIISSSASNGITIDEIRYASNPF